VKGFRGISDEVVRARTGKPSREWYQILDEWGAREKGHTRTAKHLVERYGLSGWWSQCVTIRYEWERGLRKES
jgi:hypothetical protein